MDRTEKQVLRTLLAHPQTFWRLIRNQDGHLAHYVEVMSSMISKGIIESTGDYLYLTEKGKETAIKHGLSPYEQVTCNTCEGKSVTLQGKFARALEEFKDIARNRPSAIAEYDQGYVDPASTMARVAVMYQRGDLENQNIFLVGDDDLTSIAIALTNMAKHITVLEVDERLVEFIESTAKKYGWNNISVKQYDVRESLNSELQGQYETFLLDPVETLPGISLFLARCAQSLRGKGGAGYFGLTHLEASRKKWHSIQKLILEMNFVITDIIHNFQEYELEKEGFITKNYPLVSKYVGQLPVPDINWYTSNFFRIEAIDKPVIPENDKVPFDREFYFDDEAYATLPK